MTSLWSSFILALLATSVAQLQANIAINVGTHGCNTSMPITNGVSQSFQLSSVMLLSSIDIWITDQNKVETSYNVELWEGEGGTTKLATSTMTLTAGSTPEWYSFAFAAYNLLLQRSRAYTFKLFPQSPASCSGAVSICYGHAYSGGRLLFLNQTFSDWDMSFRVQALPLAAHWPFNGTMDDASSANRGPAVPVRSNVTLITAVGSDGHGYGYLQIRQPGYVNLPRVDIHAGSFTVSFSLRVPASSSRRFLYSDWSLGEWQFLSTIDAASTVSVLLRRNILAGQDLVRVTSSAAVPVGAWFDVAWTFDRSARTLTLFFNKEKVGSARVRAGIANVTLKDSPSSYYQFGRKADDPGGNGLLDADLRDLRVFVSSDHDV